MTSAPGSTRLLRAEQAVHSGGVIKDAWILLDGVDISAVGQGPEAPRADRTTDFGNSTLVPGFIDLHGHGGASGAYDNGPGEIRAALALHRSHGTTRSVLSLVANPLTVLTKSLETIRDTMAHDPLILGAHLEGPFLSPHNHGAHQKDYLIEPTPEHLTAVMSAGEGIVRQITVAPELPGALKAITRIRDAGVIAAVGHTLASYDMARAAFAAGATLLTHTFNAMPGIHHRNPGPIVAAANDDRVTLELILDAVHLAPAVAAMLFHAAPGRIALITDAMAAAGAADGNYQLGTLAVTVKNGTARLAHSDTIAGSTLTQDQALRIAVTEAGIDLPAAITALTRTPADALGLGHRYGRLAAGYAADVVVLTPDLMIRQVWANGVPLATV